MEVGRLTQIYALIRLWTEVWDTYMNLGGKEKAKKKRTLTL